MNEAQVTADGRTYPLGPPFMILATQNPYEFEGTYFLPENQLDRFMLRVAIGYPDRPTEREILLIEPARTRLATLQPVMSATDLVSIQEQVLGVRMDSAITEYILAIAEATRRNEELAIGLSPRGSLALMQASKASALLAGRDYVVPDDVRNLATCVCAHRLMTRALSQDASASTVEAVFNQILKTIPVPK